MEVQSGFLTVKVPSVLKTKMYSNFWCVLYSGRFKISPRIDLYQEKTSLGQISHKKTICIEEAKWKSVDSTELSFSFEVKHKLYTFVSPSESDFEVWFLSLCCVSKDLFDTKCLIGLTDGDKMDIKNLRQDEDEIVVRENFLYSSNSDLHTFIVAAEQTEGCAQAGLKGIFKLRIGEAILRLFKFDTEREVTNWPLQDLKNYGHSHHTVFFQAGSRCKSGAGKYIFCTTEGDRIVQCLVQESERIREQKLKATAAAQITLTMQTESFAQSSNMKSKPPLPPSKPKSVSLGSSGNGKRQDEHQDSCYEVENRSSKKMSPAFGVPVFAPRTNATAIGSRASDYVSSTAEDGNCNQETSVSLDLIDRCSLTEDDRKHMAVARTISSLSSDSVSKKDSKRMQKEFKKEQKRREEEEKKERKRQEEEKKKEKKRKEEEEKKIKKERKKSKQKASKTVSNSSSQSAPANHQDFSNEYAEAGDFAGSSYTEVEAADNASQPCSNSDMANSERIYSEPWGNLPLIAPPSGEDGSAVEYAQPQKKSSEKVTVEPREIVHTENYEECQGIASQDSAPAIDPPDWEQEEENNGKNLYAHLHQTVPAENAQENLYGMASASAPVTYSEDENPYEETSISAYERVG